MNCGEERLNKLLSVVALSSMSSRVSGPALIDPPLIATALIQSLNLISHDSLLYL